MELGLFAACMHAILGFNVRGSCLIRENHEHLYPRNIPAIRYAENKLIMFYGSDSADVPFRQLEINANGLPGMTLLLHGRSILMSVHLGWMMEAGSQQGKDSFSCRYVDIFTTAHEITMQR